MRHCIIFDFSEHLIMLASNYAAAFLMVFGITWASVGVVLDFSRLALIGGLMCFLLGVIFFGIAWNGIKLGITYPVRI